MEESQDREQEVEKLARDLDHQAGDMESRIEELKSETDSTRQEFQRRRDDPSVPGLEPQAGAPETPPEDSDPNQPDAA